MTILLPDGCTMSKPICTPANWASGGRDLLKIDWYISYRFRDPRYREKYPKGKKIIIKGMNVLKTLEERRAFVRATIDDIIYMHKVEGVNPITKQVYTPPPVAGDIAQTTLLLRALRKALVKLKCEKRTVTDVRNCLTYVDKSARALGYDLIQVGQIKRKHIRLILDNCRNVKKYWSASLFNNYRKYLSMLFKELVEVDAIDHNPVTLISKEKTLAKIRQTMTDEERATVDRELKQTYYGLWRYMHIFYHSGCRTAELFKLQVKDVDLQNQTFKIVRMKGQAHYERLCPIKTVALPLWAELVQGAGPDQYLFSEYLKPGDKPIRPDQVTKSWKRHVKDRLGITADFYSIKHSHADDIARLHGLQAAQGVLGHSSERMTLIYATGQKAREMEAMKGMGNTFTPDK